MASPSLILGPPEIYLTTPSSADLTTPTAGKPESTSSGNSFIDAMVSSFNNLANKPPMGFTENFSPTFLSSGNLCLDFFFHVVLDTTPEILMQRLGLARNHNALTTLKLVCNLRGVRGTGKSDKEGLYTAGLWLHKNHPKTLAYLPEILYRLIEGADVRRIKKKEKPIRFRTLWWSYCRSQIKKIVSMAKKAVERYSCDPEYRFLHDRVSDVFAELLRADLQFLKSEQYGKISLAAKWCPSLDSSFDRTILVCESIARRVFPRDSYPEYEGIEEAHYAYRIRDRLRKEYLVPHMSANLWNSLPYNRVASVAMKTYKDHFQKHDKGRFKECLSSVQRGEAKIAAGALLPHEIIASLYDYDGGQVAELQWQRMVDDLSKNGTLKNCIAVCDVSGSMYGTPMDVCVALVLLISELSDEPWKGKVITFSADPQLQMIIGDVLRSKTQFIQEMDWGMNTDFQKVLEQMIKRVFVFGDMEFDEASGNNWVTDYVAIQRKFKESGYAMVPEIVFWNLRDSEATPVLSNQRGVALVSGFSKNLVKLFLENDGVLSPEAVMELAISGKEYQKLVVLD
ncbi:hypothetical protein NE237_025347 [Protea cynaroides]|uniref:Uncharacterized protein n=1 Tax=Protea cynaroides TaxID=273540 RepID=A0A9Q0H1P8_9MAGN|nr:hypothetical protein NE237_025347 [Protea cynaroides]